MNLRSTRSLAILTLLPLVLVACGPDEPEGRDVIKPVPSGAADAQASAPPMTGQGTGGDLQYKLPEGWVTEPPNNSMRMAQARIPGDAGDGELALFYFGPGGGGGVEANISRWVGQVEGAQPERDTFQVGDLTVHTVVAVGTLTGSPMSMQGGQPAPQEGSMLLGAVVEGPGGPWFFKATGPEATLEPYRSAFLDMLHDLSLGG